MKEDNINMYKENRCEKSSLKLDYKYGEEYSKNVIITPKYRHILKDNLLNGAIVKYESYDFFNEHIIELDCTNTKCKFDYLRFTFKSLLYDTEIFLDKMFTKVELYEIKDGFGIIFSIYQQENNEYKEDYLKLEDKKIKREELCYIIEAKELIIEEIKSIFYENDMDEYLKKSNTKKGEEFKLKILQQWMDNEDIGYYYRFNELISMSRVITDEYDRRKEVKNLNLSKDLQYFVENFDFRECTVNDFGMKDDSDFYINIETCSNYFKFNEDKSEVELLQVIFKGTKNVEANNTGFIDSCCIKIDYDNTIEFQLLVESDGYNIIKVHAEDLVIEFMK